MTNWLSPKIILPELHAFIGAAVTFGIWLLVPAEWSVYGIPIRYLGMAVFLVGDFLKEALWDPVHEPNNPLYPEGLIDLGWYTVGILVALVIIYARFRGI